MAGEDEGKARALSGAVEGILSSYREHGNINHLDGTNLPSRREVGKVLDELLSLVFPGYFADEQVDGLSLRFFVGERCARLLRALERILGRAVALDGPEADVRTRVADTAMGMLQAIPSLRAMLATDLDAAMAGDPAARDRDEVIMSYPGVEAIAVHRIAHHLHAARVPIIPRMMSELVHSRTGIDIHPGATIGSSFFIDHGTGVVIGETTRIGDRVKLYQGVTLGALSVRNDGRAATGPRHPTLEDDVTVYAGATILGGNTVIGQGSVIGGNVWLTHSVPAGTTVALGNPSLRFLGGTKRIDEASEDGG